MAAFTIRSLLFTANSCEKIQIITMYLLFPLPIRSGKSRYEPFSTTKKRKTMTPNNYLKILLYLKKFEGDGLMHDIEDLLPELSVKQKKVIFQELADENLIKFNGHEEQYLSFVVEHNTLTKKTKTTESPFNKDVLNSPPNRFKAKITFKGIKFLKEEIQMKESGKYNINVSGDNGNNNFIIESKIDNRQKTVNEIGQIINSIETDNSISKELQEQSINTLNQAKEDIESKGSISNSVAAKLLSLADQVSSVGGFLLSLGIGG